MRRRILRLLGPNSSRRITGLGVGLGVRRFKCRPVRSQGLKFEPLTYQTQELVQLPDLAVPGGVHLVAPGLNKALEPREQERDLWLGSNKLIASASARNARSGTIGTGLTAADEVRKIVPFTAPEDLLGEKGTAGEDCRRR